MMRVFLAGATGAIGRRVLPQLISAGHEVTAMVRSAAGAQTVERAQAARSPEWVVLRYGMLYGPGTWYSPAGDMADRARRGELPATPDVTSFVHVDDAAAAAVRALTWPSGAFNVCDDEPAPASAWVPAFGTAVGAPPPPSPASAERTGFARGADNTRARRVLGWTPRWPTWRDGFAELEPDAQDGTRGLSRRAEPRRRRRVPEP